MSLPTYSVLTALTLLTVPAAAQQARKPAKAAKPNVEISGKLLNAPAGTKVYVMDSYNGRSARLDSATVDAQGRFMLKTRVPDAAVYYLAVEKQQEAMGLPLAAGSKLQVSGDATKLVQTGAVRGSGEADTYFSFQQARMRNMEQSRALMGPYRAASDEATRAAIEKQYEALEAEATDRAKRLARQPTYLAPYAALTLIGNEAQTMFLDSVTAVYQKVQPLSRYTKALLEHQARQRATAIGAVAPDIQLADASGKVVPLSSLRGKYVLIDFWASWCGPCRQENPNVVKLYNAYKNKGFEIYGVSLDQDKAKWQKAIEADGLGWTHVSDLKGWQSAAGQTYGVRSIPASVLLDPQGRIIAKNLRGEELEKKVAAVLQEAGR